MNCGHSLAVICPNCSFQNVYFAKFCINCGFSLRGNSPAINPPPGIKENVPAVKDTSARKFIPKDYEKKLELARQSQTMKGERRIVSILFCDVKGSTSMAEQLDPEDWAEVMNQAFEYLITPIYTYEGTLARLMGDSVLAFFGAPIGHEDDAKRAILAGLKIVQDIQSFKEKIRQKYDLDFNVRVGINTGLVVVGGVGSDLFMEYTAQGDAINIAARMEQTAEPGTIQVGEDTYKQTADTFEFDLREDVTVRGKSEPVKVYRVLGVKDQPLDEHGLHTLDIPMIGRENELNILRQAMASVQRGRGQIVCMMGEAGLGKTRLLQEAHKIWEETLSTDVSFGMIASRWNQASGMSYESSRPYGLIQHLIRNYIGLKPADSSEITRQKIYDTLSMINVNVNNEWLDLFELMLGVKEQVNEDELSGEELKNKIYTEMLKTLERLIQDGPAVIATDDLQWADQASAEFLVHLFQLVDHYPVLFLCSFRTHHDSQAWMVKQRAEMDYAHRYTQINLLPLSNSESNQLINAYFLGMDIPEKIRTMVLEKSDGNPFFMEEVIQELLEEKIIVQDTEHHQWKTSSLVEDFSIPENLNSMITARIDRLDEAAKHVLQMASVVGRSFYHQVLEIINDVSDNLDQELIKLQRMGLIIEKGREPDPEYMFRQALTQEAAYNTILLKYRREYHRRVGEAILKLYPDRMDEFSSLLAHHFYQARDARALQYFKSEGDAALFIYANNEAIYYYTKAIEAANWKKQPDLNALSSIYLKLGRAYELESQFNKALEVYKKFESLAIKSEDKLYQMQALIAQAQIYSVPSTEFSIKIGMPIVHAAEKIAHELNDQEALAKIYWLQMNLYRFSENPDQAQVVGEKAIALARKLNLEEQLAFSLNDANHAYNMNGQVTRAKEVSLEAVEIWKKLNNKPMLADSLGGLASISAYSGDFDQAYEYSETAFQISEQINNIWGKAYSRFSIGLVDLLRGDFSLAIEHLQQTM
ncbi:MAG: adenylate/guanylate cyclase domain-containing protein, partial [Anaerolineales bacterium]